MKLIQNPNRKISESERQEFLTRGHSKTCSRREFLSKGAIAGAGFVFVPSLLSLMSRRVEAQSLSCAAPLSAASSLFPIIFIDHGGGSAFANDFVVGGVGGQMDFITGVGAYENYGLPDDQNYNAMGITPDTSLGVAFHPSSPFLAGIKSILPSQYYPSVDGFTIAAETDDDTENNPLGGLQYAGMVGRKGLLVPTIGTDNNASGGRHKAAEFAESPEYMPVRIQDQGSARRVGGFGNMFESDRLGVERAQKVLRAISTLSSTQLNSFNNLSLQQQADLMIRCGYLNAVDLPSLYSPEAIFPLNPDVNDPIRTAFGGTFNQRSASIARLVMNEFAGAGCDNVGGYDNHDGSSVNPNLQRFQAGVLVGRYLYYAALLGKPIFIAGTTDGGMGVLRNGSGVLQVDNTAPNGQGIGGFGWARRPGDNGNTSLQWCMTYVPNSTRGQLVQASGRQIGAYRKEGVIRDYLVTAKSPTRVAQVMMYNYLALQGRESEVKDLNNGVNPFGGSDAAKYLIFKKAPGV